MKTEYTEVGSVFLFLNRFHSVSPVSSRLMIRSGEVEGPPPVFLFYLITFFITLQKEKRKNDSYYRSSRFYRQ